MAQYRYRAVNEQGGECTGCVRGDSLRLVRAQLQAQGLFPVEIEVEQSGEPGSSWRARRQAISATPLVVLTRQWATLLAAGMSVEQSLSAIVEQSDDAAIKWVISGVRQALLAGHPLHVALADFPKSFDALYCGVVEAGERTGKLDEVMLRLADMLEAAQTLRQRVVQALAYPAVIVLVAVLVVGGLMVWVVPQVAAVFQHGQQRLPLSTQILMALSEFLRTYWYFLFALIFGALFILRRLLRIPLYQNRCHQGLMRLPSLGKLLVAIDSARMAQTLALLVGSGVPILSALDAAQKVLRLQPLRQALSQAIVRVREGGTLSKALATAGNFPPMLVHMIASGELSGRLPEMLARCAGQQQQEVSNRLSIVVSLLEPLLLLLIGGAVLSIVIAVLQPIIEMNQMLR